MASPKSLRPIKRKNENHYAAAQYPTESYLKNQNINLEDDEKDEYYDVT